MNKKKILSLIMALVMLVGVFSPLSALAAEVTTTEKVTLHKLIMTKDELSKWDSAKIEEKGYNATQNMTEFKKLLESGHSAKEIPGVFFALKFAKDFEIPEDNKTTIVAQDVSDGKAYVKASANDKLTPAKPLTSTTNIEEAVGGKTTENGVVFVTSGLKGKFEIDEIHEKSSYKGEKGETLTDMKAVPTEITLPLVNNDGIVGNAHVYPKNTEDKPKIDKNFDKEKEDKENKKLVEESDIVSANKNLDLDLNDNSKDKATVSKKVGDIVPYKVVTEIPAQTKWATAKWDDKMTEGLTYNNGSLTIELKMGQNTINLKAPKENNGESTIESTTKEQPESDYTIKEENNGFVLEFTKTGLKKLNNQAETQTITLKYTATLNNKAVADVEESNDITFHYGNTPGHGNTPIPNKPKNGEMEFTKSWVDEKGNTLTPPAGTSVTVQLYNANTGKTVGEAKTLNAGNSWKATWTGLDNDTEYKVVETAVAGYEAEYSKGEGLGKLGVKNWKSDNPTPLNPTEPKVVNGGRRFVKTNNEEKGSTKLERLAGAEFYVKNAEGKYLVTKEKTTTKIADAKTTLENAVKAYNGLSAEEQKGETGKTKKAEIDAAQKAYDKAIKENASAYEWGNKTDANVVVLTSDTEGRFEITGLAYGKYKLEEKTAPKGFAKLNDNDSQLEFEVKKESYDGADSELDYQVSEKVTKHGQQIKNKTVSIPQTGGMGTVLFTVVGISLMAGAVIAMKRNREEA